MFGLKKKSESNSNLQKSKRQFSSNNSLNSPSSGSAFTTQIIRDDGRHETWSERSKSNDAMAHKYIKNQIAITNYATMRAPPKSSFQYLKNDNAERFQKRILLEKGKSTNFDNPNEKAVLKAISWNFYA